MDKRLTHTLWVFLLIAALVTSSSLAQAPATAENAAVAAVPAPPATRTDNVKDTLHGVELVDPYRWLEDQWDAGTRAWIESQNKYTDSVVNPLPGRGCLEKRLTELLRVESINIPSARNGRYFFSKRGADQDLFVIYMRQGLDGKDEVLIDPHGLSADHTTSVNLQEISEDGTLVVYGIREGGQDEVSLRFRDVGTGKDLAEVFPNARYGSPSLTSDKKVLYYVKWTKEGPRVYRHVMGTDPAADKVIFGEGYGPEKIIGAGLSDDGRWLVLTVLYGSAADKTEVYAMDVANQGPVVTIVKDIPARFFGGVGGDTLYLQTNWNAPNNRILGVDLKNPAQENWREVVPEQEKAVLRGMSLAGGRIFVNYMRNVRTEVRVFEPDGRRVRDIEFPALGSASGINGRWDSGEAFYSFSSYHIPTTIYRYDVAGGQQSVWARLNVPVDTEQFAVRQVWYESKDGTLVPMWLIHKKGLRLDGNNPTYLTGYGGFNLSMTPGFSSRAVVWVEQGGVYAVPNLRGGGEFGEKWHQAGMRANKQNVFDDFIGAAEWLIANGYTRPEKLAIAGGSNGGLLVGAAMTQRPDLYRAVVCSYPLLDMVRYQQFLVARFWVPEYGSAEDAEQFKYIRAYSPYHNVKKGTAYPATLFITGDSDTRVDPLHARKMAALVQAANGGDRPALLRYDTKAGHSGGLPVSKQIEDLTDELSFLFWQLGIAQ